MIQANQTCRCCVYEAKQMTEIRRQAMPSPIAMTGILAKENNCSGAAPSSRILYSHWTIFASSPKIRSRCSGKHLSAGRIFDFKRYRQNRLRCIISSFNSCAILRQFASVWRLAPELIRPISSWTLAFVCWIVLACNDTLDCRMDFWRESANKRPKLVPKTSKVRPINPMPFVTVWICVSFELKVNAIICAWTPAIKAA